MSLKLLFQAPLTHNPEEKARSAILNQNLEVKPSKATNWKKYKRRIKKSALFQFLSVSFKTIMFKKNDQMKIKRSQKEKEK